MGNQISKDTLPNHAPLIIVRLNDRAQPLDRGELYEVPLDYFLKRAQLGEIMWGGTQLTARGEIKYCEVELSMWDSTEESLELILAALERLGAPRGSKLIVGPEGREVEFGVLEGLAVYHNGTDLPDSTYRNCDVNIV